MSGRLDPQLERIAERAAELVEIRAAVARYRRRQERRDELVAAVAAYLGEHPAASSRDVSRALRRRRQDVLDVLRELRASEGRLPSRGNRHDEATA